MPGTVPELKDIKSLDPCLLGMTVEQFLGNYKGKHQIARIRRLAAQIPSIAKDLLHIAQKMASEGYDVDEYSDLANESDRYPDISLEPDENTSLAIKARFDSELSRLKQEMSDCKENLRREMLFDVYHNMGELYIKSGAFSSAYNTFSESLSYAVGYQQQLEANLNMLRAASFTAQLPRIEQIILRIEQFDLDESDPNNRAIYSVCKSALGMQYLWASQYKLAAYTFLEVYDELSHNFDEFVVAADVACMAVLCALATFTSQEIRQHIVQNTSFQKVLDAMPELRHAISGFQSRNFRRCLSTLRQFRACFLLSPVYGDQVDVLLEQIRIHCVCQYVQPYSTISVAKMAEEMGDSVEHLEETLSALVLRGSLSATIDKIEHKYTLLTGNVRSTTLEQSLAQLHQTAHKIHCSILRMNATVTLGCAPFSVTPDPYKPKSKLFDFPQHVPNEDEEEDFPDEIEGP